MFIEILFKIVLFKGGVLIYAEHCNTYNQLKCSVLSVYFYIIIFEVPIEH